MLDYARPGRECKKSIRAVLFRLHSGVERKILLKLGCSYRPNQSITNFFCNYSKTVYGRGKTMKKVISISALITAIFLVFASPAYASGGNGHHKGHYKHHKHHHHHGRYDPPRRYFDDHHRYYRDARYDDRRYRRQRNDRRWRRDRDNNTLLPTLLGGGIGGAAGYGLSGGDGIFTGLGAATGAYIGHELAD